MPTKHGNVSPGKLVRTEESKSEEMENFLLAKEIMGFKYEHQITKHHLLRQIRLQHETINDLVLELFGQNADHIIFKDSPRAVKSTMHNAIAQRENMNNWGFGKETRNKMHF